MYPFSVSWKITPLYFLSSNNIHFAHKEPIKMKIFETFERSDQNLSNSFCQFLNDQSIPLEILYPSSVSWKITTLYFLSTNNIHFLLIRSPLKWKSLRLSSALVKNPQISYPSFETTNQFHPKFCLSLQFHERLLLRTFLGQTIYTLLIRTPLKWKSLRLLSAQIKICQIPYANF